MAYIKHTWVSTDAITAARLNNLEDGVETALASGQFKFAAARNTAQASEFSSYTAGDGNTYYRAIINVNFGKTFNTIPSITVSADTTIPCRVNAGYHTPTTTGFQLYIERANNAEKTGYSWQAIGT